MQTVDMGDLEARLRRYLGKVRLGHTLIVFDRGTPIAKIVPYDAQVPLEIRRATRKPRDLRIPPAPARATDSLSVLLQDRASS